MSHEISDMQMLLDDPCEKVIQLQMGRSPQIEKCCVQYHRDSLRCVYLPYIRSVNVARDAHELVDNGAGRRGVLCVLVFFGFLVFLLLLCPF